jgi:hypothetical protein
MTSVPFVCGAWGFACMRVRAFDVCVSHTHATHGLSLSLYCEWMCVCVCVGCVCANTHGHHIYIYIQYRASRKTEWSRGTHHQNGAFTHMYAAELITNQTLQKKTHVVVCSLFERERLYRK